jgi:VIT1/CCC1 family predicted Fe2+/Mn2+ transporter
MAGGRGLGAGVHTRAVLPLLAILLPAPAWRVAVCVAVVLVALGVAGWVSAVLGGVTRPSPSPAS